ncbi:MAG: hypothetical protein AB7L13_01055 [Acidimicrobiia bacterium]
MQWPWTRRGHTRESGEPTGGVSSFHLWWGDQPAEPVTEVLVTCEVVQAPTASRLYFWAVQADFVDASGRSHGAAHGGFQWNPSFPPNYTALNWGGYSNASDVTSILTGTESPLPSTPNDPNTRDYPWIVGRPYRFRIHKGARGWAFDVVDTVTGLSTTVRELLVGGDRLRAVVVWSEVFCRCDHESAIARWSDFEYRTASGASVRPRTATTNFPAFSAGDCTNTDIRTDGAGAVVMLTNAERTIAPGVTIEL